jgi:hypothetical protein
MVASLRAARCRKVCFRDLRLVWLVAPMLAAAPQSANAQGGRNFSSYFLDVVPAKFVAAAFEQPYGRAVAAQFSAALTDSADPACLKAKAITTTQIEERARSMLTQRGAYVLERAVAMTDRAKFKSYLKARLGKDGAAELERLRNDPDVKAYRAVDEPAELAFITAYIVENINRYAIINRIELAKPISPIASDIASIDEADPTGKIDEKLKEMVAGDKSGKLARYLEMFAMAQKPFADAADMKTAMKFGPGELLARPGKDKTDLYNELVDLCVARPRRGE